MVVNHKLFPKPKSAEMHKHALDADNEMTLIAPLFLLEPRIITLSKQAHINDEYNMMLGFRL